MRTKKALPFFFLCTFASTAYVATSACGSSDFSSADDGDASVVNGSCDTSQTPSQTSCVINEAYGVFVATTATAAGADGTRAHPFATLQAGITSAKTQQKRVYACVGTYAEQITIADGVSVFGNLDCAHDWAPITQHALLKAPTSPAVRADQIQSPTRIDSLDIDAPDGTPASKNSIGVIATASPGLTIANATIQAGAGFDGIGGVEGAQLVQSSDGNGAGSGSGGVAYNAALSPHPDLSVCPGYRPLPSASCLPNTASGGTTSCVAPADAGVDAAPFQPGVGGTGGAGGECSLTDTCTTGVGAGVMEVACCTDTPAAGGAPSGNAPIAGTNGRNAVGIWSGTTYVSGDGVGGTDGSPGQGGAGGGGIDPFLLDYGTTHKAAGYIGQGISGSGGGSGGCPGLAGTFGTGGGASIAIVTDSAIILDTCVVKSGNGGRAGQGTFGSAPTSGGGGGPPIDPPTGGSGPPGSGKSGSAGGTSGWSGNGGAGPSYAIASHGAAPVLKNTTSQAGIGGKGVPQRTLGAKTIPATPDGSAAPSTTF
ncbi:MAG: hypothetical protein ABI183_20905 [Polyangiaceae bacterium]